MGGRASKQKGSRAEYKLRDILREAGWQSDRQPLSGAMARFKGDVTAEKDGVRVLYEVKCRKDLFKWLYQLAAAVDGELLAKLSCGTLIHVTANLPTEAGLPTGTYVSGMLDPRTEKKFHALRVWLQECDVLAVKNDRMPFIYVRWG